MPSPTLSNVELLWSSETIFPTLFPLLLFCCRRVLIQIVYGQKYYSHSPGSLLRVAPGQTGDVSDHGGGLREPSRSPPKASATHSQRPSATPHTAYTHPESSASASWFESKQSVVRVEAKRGSSRSRAWFESKQGVVRVEAERASCQTTTRQMSPHPATTPQRARQNITQPVKEGTNAVTGNGVFILF